MRKILPITSVVFCMAALIVSMTMYVNASGSYRGGLATAKASTEDSSNTITVTQKYTTTIEPDKASVTVSVNTDADTAAKAQKNNSKAVNTVTSSLSEQGIKETSIKTSGYNLSPQYDYSGSTPKFKGYTASSTLTVDDIDADNVGKILGAVVTGSDSDGNTIEVNSVDFSSSKYDEVYNEALSEAVKESKTKAESIADAAGKKLDGITSVTEGYQNDYAKYTTVSYNELATESTTDSANATIIPGQLKIDAEVTVVYNLN